MIMYLLELCNIVGDVFFYCHVASGVVARNTAPSRPVSWCPPRPVSWCPPRLVSWWLRRPESWWPLEPRPWCFTPWSLTPSLLSTDSIKANLHNRSFLSFVKFCRTTSWRKFEIGRMVENSRGHLSLALHLRRPGWVYLATAHIQVSHLAWWSEDRMYIVSDVIMHL